MSINRIRLKEDAKVKIATAKPAPYLPTIAYLFIIFIISVLQSRLDERFTVFVRDVMKFALQTAPWPTFDLSYVLRISALFVILLKIVAEVFSTGYKWFSLRISRYQSATLSNILDPMSYLFKVAGLYIAMSVFSFLWSLLFVIPGIVASYSYRQAYYILHDHPEYGIMQCIRESKRLMRGNKMDLFVLDLSFIGWALLCSLTFGILLVWKIPYFEVTYANFYNALKFHSQYGQSTESSFDGEPWDNR